jgi:6-phosphogluconolactonase (cycloisomerase 2 family)
LFVFVWFTEVWDTVMNKFLVSLLLFLSAPVNAELLTYQGAVSVSAPTDAAFSQDGNYLYVTTLSQTENQLRVFERDDTGELAERFLVSDPSLVFPWGLVLEGSDLYVIVKGAAGVSEGGLLHLTRNPDGSIALPPVSASTLGTPTEIAMSNSRDSVYVLTEGSDGSTGSLVVYSRNSSDGALTQLQEIAGLSGPGRIALSNDDRVVYVSDQSNSRIHLFKRDSVSGLLSEVETYIDGEAGFENLGGVFQLTLSKDGRFLYTGNAIESSIAVLNVDGTTGALSPGHVYRQGELNRIGELERPVDGIDEPFDLLVSADGESLYVVGFDAGEAGTPLTDLSLFRINPVDGSLAYVETHSSDTNLGLHGAVRLVVAQETASLYSMGLLDSNLAHWHHATANLAVTLEDDVDPVLPGSVVNYALSVVNNGNTAEGVKLHYGVPGGASLVSVDHDGCEAASVPVSVECELGVLATGAANAITINLQVSAPSTPGIMSNQPVAFSASLDTDVADNTMLEETLVSDFVNTAPTGVSDTITTLPGQAVEADIVANDTDPDGQTLFIADGSVAPLTADTQGVMEKIESDRVRYTPPASVEGIPFTGYAHFVYRVSDDNADSADTDIVVIVNTPPEVADDTAMVDSGESVNVLVLANDGDMDGDLLSIESIDDGGLLGGVAVLEADNTITYIANAGFVGTDSLSYTIVDDKEGRATGALTVTSRDASAPPGGDGDAPSAADSSGGGGSFGVLLLLVVVLFGLFQRALVRVDVC